MAYEKTDNILELAIWMQATREGVSLNDIAERFQVSRRTAERMRDAVCYRFPQTEDVVGENNMKRWYIPQGTLKDFIQFTAEELSTLETARQLLCKNHLEDKLETLDSVINKIKANIKADTFRKIEPDTCVLLEAEGFALRAGPQIKVDKEIITQIREAILSCHQIRIAYKNQNSGKISYNTLMPYGILYGERNHYLLAKHSDGYFGDAVHYFILSNIQSITLTPDIYEIPHSFNLKEFTENSFGVFQEEPFEVEWCFDKEVAEDAKRYIFHPTQTLTENADGSLTVKFKAGGRKEMDWHLYTWGNHVKVIKPTDWYDVK